MLGKTVIVLLLAGIVFGIVSIVNNGSESETKNASVTDSVLPITEGDIPVVKEDEDKTGEVLPPADTTQQPPVDINGDDLGFPPQ